MQICLCAIKHCVYCFVFLPNVLYPTRPLNMIFVSEIEGKSKRERRAREGAKEQCPARVGIGKFEK